MRKYDPQRGRKWAAAKRRRNGVPERLGTCEELSCLEMCCSDRSPYCEEHARLHVVKKALALDDSFGHWLAGLVDGEGCFLFHVDNRYGGCRPRFQLKLRDDDLTTIKYVMANLKLGSLVRGKARKSSRPNAVWVVADRYECAQLVEVLKRFPLRSKKARDFYIWAEGVAEWPTYQQSREDRHVWDPLWNLRERLRETRAYKTPA